MEKHIKTAFDYIKTFAKWLVIATLVGIAGGGVGILFHYLVDYVTEKRIEHSFLIYLLPIAGILIAALYRAFHKEGKIDTNRVIDSIRKNKNVPIIMVPLIFVSTVITHAFGGSAGREGAALQIGGGLGYNIGRLFKLNENDTHIITMAGMSSVFAALFGTPVTAAVFSLEVICVGSLNYAGLLPCIIAAVVAYGLSLLLGVSPMRFDVMVQAFTAVTLIKVIILAVLCAVLSSIFCQSIKRTEKYMDKFFKNCYLRAFAGGLIIVILTLLVKNYDYNGAGMNVIERAIGGVARPVDFIFKIIFTAITIGAGFKGGEIVPTLFIGSTFGCVMGQVLGLDAGFCAAIAMIAMFCGVVNSPVASMLLAVELFGSDGLLFYAVACGVSYIMSGYSGLYKSQKIVFSKLNAEPVDENTK